MVLFLYLFSKVPMIQMSYSVHQISHRTLTIFQPVSQHV